MPGDGGRADFLEASRARCAASPGSPHQCVPETGRSGVANGILGCEAVMALFTLSRAVVAELPGEGPAGGPRALLV
jgi:hypothetical protein